MLKEFIRKYLNVGRILVRKARKIKKQIDFSFIELRHELDEKTEEIKNLSYETLGKLNSMQKRKINIQSVI